MPAARAIHRLLMLGALTAAAAASVAMISPARAPAEAYDIPAASFAARGLVAPGITVQTTWAVPPDQAFQVMTDSSAWKERFSLETRIDLAIGGRFELLFGAGRTPPVPEGQQGSETCQILSYIPGEMLSFSWNAPPTFEERAEHTWVVITFSPGPESGTTNLRLRHVGFGQGGRWAEVETYFQNAWERLLTAMGDDLAR